MKATVVNMGAYVKISVFNKTLCLLIKKTFCRLSFVIFSPLLYQSLQGKNCGNSNFDLLILFGSAPVRRLFVLQWMITMNFGSYSVVGIK